MQLALLVVISFAPALAWVYFFYRKDRFEKEPVSLLLKTFVAGILVVVPAVLVEMPFRESIVNPTSSINLFLVAFFVIGFGEEFFKFLAVRLTAYRSEFNEVIDGIIYFITAALGFAGLENLLYTMAFGIPIAPLRAILTSLAHASFSGILGYYAGISKTTDAGNGPFIYGFFIATVLHGGYDYVIMSELVPPIWALVMIGGFYVLLSSKIKRAINMSPFRPH